MIGNIVAESQWEIDRLGKFTASKINALLTPPKYKSEQEAGLLSKTAITYIHQKASEIITGTIRQFSDHSTEWGNDYESEIAEIMKEKHQEMEYFGSENPKFYPYSDFSGGSPDAIVESKRLVLEFKCPEDPSKHILYCLLNDESDLEKQKREYYNQLQFNMLCVSQYLNIPFLQMKGQFISYCPIVSDNFKNIKIIDVSPNLEFVYKIEDILPKAEIYLSEILKKMKL